MQVYKYFYCLFSSKIDQTFLFRFGDSTGDLTVSLLAFPTKWIILIGALLSTIGAGLQTLTGYVCILLLLYKHLHLHVLCTSMNTVYTVVFPYYTCKCVHVHVQH